MLSFFKRNNSAKWQSDLVAVLAKLGVNYNSYYSQAYNFTELLSGEIKNLKVFTQFFPSRVRFKQIYIPIQVWKIKEDLLLKLGFEKVEFFKTTEFTDEHWYYIYLPETLNATFPVLRQKLNQAVKDYSESQIQHSSVEGILTSSGRSFWIPSRDGRPVCFKLDTLDIKTITPYFNSRRLDPGDVELAVSITEHLDKIECDYFLKESRGLHIKPTADEYRYVIVERYIDFSQSKISRGDLLIPMQSILADEFWQDQSNLEFFGLAGTTLGEFFNRHMVREFAKLIKVSIEKTHMHFEIHQQNLTCHLRGGHLQKIMVHDLQDVVFDPVSYLLSSLPDDWEEKINFVTYLYRTRFFNFYGEQRREIEKHRHFFTPHTFYRRYFRNFGNFTRIYNKSNGENYLFSRKAEELLVNELSYSEEELGIDKKIKSHDNYSFLSKNPFWVVERRIIAKQKNAIRTIFSKLANKAPLAEDDTKTLFKKIDAEVAVFSANMPSYQGSKAHEKVKCAYRVYQDNVYFLELEDGELVSVVFFPV